MKRLTPPILKVYTDKQLATALAIPHWQVRQACENGDIQAELVPERVETEYGELGGSWVSLYTGKSRRVSSSCSVPAYWKIPKNEALRLEAELFKPEEIEKQPVAITDNQNTINSLFKIIAVMAVDGYGYDVNQERSPIPNQLSEIAEGLGVSISDKTIRKHLKDAVLSHIKQQD